MTAIAFVAPVLVLGLLHLLQKLESWTYDYSAPPAQPRVPGASRHV